MNTPNIEARLRLNVEAFDAALLRSGLQSDTAAGAALGVDRGTLRRLRLGIYMPSSAFIAACMARLRGPRQTPVAVFTELFRLVENKEND